MYFLSYGRSVIEMPDLWDGRSSVLSPGPFPDPDPESAVNHALDHPIGGMGLEEFCCPHDRVACVVPDLTRRAAVRDYLPLVLKRLSDIGVARDDVKIIVGLGIHRPLNGFELETLLGPEVVMNYTVINHDADGGESITHLGTTDAGIPVQINSEVATADKVILTGSITYHYFAGYGGGRKSVLPGVASRRSCEAHHKMVVSWRRGELEGKIAPGVLKGNPVHSQMVQACRLMPPLFVLNVITDPQGGIITASAGELEEAHEDACRKFDSWYRKDMGSLSKLVIASVGGHPKDVNFVQAHKGLFAAHQAVAGGGVVILAAECPEGTGHPDLLKWFDRCPSEKVWLKELEELYQINGQTAFSTWLRVTKVPTVLISGLKRTDVEKMGMISAGNMGEALKTAEEILGGLPVPLIIPDAGDILPVVKCEG